MHRALTSLHYGFYELIGSLALLIVFTIAWLELLPYVCAFWRQVFVAGIRFLPLHAQLSNHAYHWLIYRLNVPALALEPSLPSSALWGTAGLVTIIVFAATIFIPASLTPVVYLLRALVFLQLSALVYFAVLPAQFPHLPSAYLRGLITSGIGVISIVPALFCLVYYIFPFSIAKKAFLTLSTMVHLVLFLPLQVLLHALVIQSSLMFMPVVYLVLGMTLDVFIIVTFYSWGMSWTFKERTRQ